MPDSKTPDEPFDDIIEMFRNIAENGGEPTRAPAPAAAPVTRNDSAADASVLGEAASAQAASAHAVTSPARAATTATAAGAAAPTISIPVEPATPRHVVSEPAAEAVAEPLPAPLAEAAAAEGVVPVSTIEKLLAPTPRTAPVPGPYVGFPKPELDEPSVHSEPEALAAVINGTAAPAASLAAEAPAPAAATAPAAAPVAGDDVVLTAAVTEPASVPPGTGYGTTGGDARGRRRGVVVIAGLAAAALIAAGTGYALERHGSTKNTADTTHVGDTATFGTTPSQAPTLTPSPSASPTPKQQHTHAAVVPPVIAVPSSVPTVAPSSVAVAQASQSAAMASASASLSAAIIAKEKQLAKQYAAQVASYYRTVAPLAQGFAGVISNAPTISPKDAPSAADANAFYNAVSRASHYYNALRAVKAPSTLAGAQSRLLAAMASARNNLINGQNVALNGQNCSGSCTYSDQRGWASYTSTLANTWSFPQAALDWQAAVARLLKG